MFSSGQGERLLGSTNYSEEVEEAVAKVLAAVDVNGQSQITFCMYAR